MVLSGPALRVLKRSVYCAAYLRSLVPGQFYLELCRLADADQLENGMRFARVTRAKGLVVSIGEVSFS